MKTRFIIILIAISITSALAQIDSSSFNKDIDELNNKVISFESKLDTIKSTIEQIQKANDSINESQADLKKSYKKLSNDFSNYKTQFEKKIDSLNNIINANSANIEKTTNELGVKIESTEKTTSQSITDLNKTLSQNTLYWIIAVLAVALFVLLVFVLLRKQIFKQKSDLESNLQNTRKALEEEGVKLDDKLIEVLETQLKIIDNTGSKQNKEVDHTLALKVADEIIRIQKNLTRMDENTKGLKPLTKAIERIQDNFAANGYEMITYLNENYDDRMNIEVINFIRDDSLNEGEKTVTKVIKPQVNYNGVLIQRGQVDVSYK